MNEKQEFVLLVILLVLSLLFASAWDFEDSPDSSYPAPETTTTPVAYPKPVVPTATKKPKKEKEQPKPTEDYRPTSAPTESYP